MRMSMKVSVIIPTYNEGDVIKECLKSLKNQSYNDLEIIVVDDGSTDGMTKTISGTILLKQEHKGPGAARNLGAKKAEGEILVFVDADMTFDKDFIRKLVEPIISDPTSPRLRGVKGTFSKEEYVSNWDNVWAVCWNLNRGLPKNKMHGEDYPNKQKVFRAILRSEFEKAGGFDEKAGYTDDWSLSEKLGVEAIAAPGATFYHKNPSSLPDVFVQARWMAKRNYKFGFLGGLIKAWFPIKLSPSFLIFKLVYAAGATIGIFEYYVFGKVAK